MLRLTYSTVDEAFGGLVEREGKFAKRVVYAVHRMYGFFFVWLGKATLMTHQVRNRIRS